MRRSWRLHLWKKKEKMHRLLFVEHPMFEREQLEILQLWKRHQSMRMLEKPPPRGRIRNEPLLISRSMTTNMNSWRRDFFKDRKYYIHRYLRHRPWRKTTIYVHSFGRRDILLTLEARTHSIEDENTPRGHHVLYHHPLSSVGGRFSVSMLDTIPTCDNNNQ